ncbi:TPA: Bro-N domain-containing protein [Pseudomonas aeruginosa]
MSAIIPFQFEAHAVRVQVDDAGLPWFNATDVCDALEMGNPSQAIKSHVDAEDIQKLETLTAGGRQRQNHVNESGLYALILGSTKDAAKRFKRWVTGEVLPAIRKTGAYAVPGTLAALPAPTHDRVSAILLIGEAVAKVPGVKPGIAAAATLTCIQENTGITTEVLRRALPSANEPICALNATQLGKLLNRSATREASPALLLFVDGDSITAHANHLVDRLLIVRLAVVARGVDAFDVADQALVAAHAALLADPNLGGLAIAVREIDCEWEFDDADAGAAALPARYEIRYRTHAIDLTQTG